MVREMKDYCKEQLPFVLILSCIISFFGILLPSILGKIKAEHTGSQDYERIYEAPGSSRVYWDTFRFDSLYYESDWGDTRSVYQITKEDSVYRYEATGYYNGEISFRFACYLSADEYHELMEILLKTEQTQVPDNPAWQLSWQMGGQSYICGGREHDAAYGTACYDFLGWLNTMGSGHENLYEED